MNVRKSKEKPVKMAYEGRYDLKPSKHGMTARAKKLLNKRTRGELYISTNNVS